jgi:hypothetical protein
MALKLELRLESVKQLPQMFLGLGSPSLYKELAQSVLGSAHNLDYAVK